MSQLNDLTRAYGRAISWSNFESALSATAGSEGASRPELASFADIKVVSYSPVSAQVVDDGKVVRRVVRIDYVRTSSMVERSLTVEEEWNYSDARKHWYLRSGFPQFR